MASSRSNNRVDVREFGAVGDGQTDDTKAIQTAIDTAAFVRIPAGVYRVGRLMLRGNLTLMGDGAASVLQGRPGTTLLQALSASPGAFIDNIELQGLRLSGAVTQAGFSEHVHLLSAAGVRNLLIEGVQFVGFQGDGLYLGANIDNTRHNEDVRVVNCTFDGVDRNNRNCISVIDGDNVQVRGCVFRRSSRRDMPGFIDVEPNDAANVVRNIHILGNHFEDTHGAVAAIGIVILKPRLKVAPETFVISHNTFDTNLRMLAVRVSADHTNRLDLVVTGNAGRVASLGDFYPVLRGASFSGNTLSVTGPAAFGFNPGDAMTELSITGNSIDGGGVARGVLDLRGGAGVVISSNVISRCAEYGLLCGIAGGSLAQVSIIGNTFTRCGPHAVMSAGGIDGASCRYLANASDGSHLFPAWINDDTGALVNASTTPATFNASTPPKSFARSGTYRAMIEGDRAAPRTSARYGLLETRVETGRPGTALRLQRYYPGAETGASEGFFFSRTSDRSGAWTPWMRHVGQRID